MCLSFDCGGDHSDHDRGSPIHPGNHRRPPPPPPPPLSPPPLPMYVQEDGQSYTPVVPHHVEEEAYGHYAPGGMAAGRREPRARNGGADASPRRVAAGVNRNGDRMTAAFDYSYADVPASVGVGGRGRKSGAEKNMVPALAAQAPHQQNFASSNPLHGSVAAAHPKVAAASNMKAPQVVQMPPRGGEDGYPAAAASATPAPAANHFYGARDYNDDQCGNRDNRKPQGKSWW